jgi:D-alanyl-D-alanine carboxypeptidase
MKKLTVLAVLILFIGLIVPYNGYAAAQTDVWPPAISAAGAVIIDAASGRVLAQHNMNDQLPMASTTKIMTALVVLENASLDDVVEITPQMCGIEGSSIYLKAGEHLSVYELLCGLLLRSGNDAATALAIYTAGSQEAFVEMMNRRAQELGLENTRFQNPHGLPDPQHYTTALELARIAAEAMKNPVFAQIVATQKAQIPWEGEPWDRVLTNKNKILTMVEGGNGIKTGYTKAAGRCLVGAAKRDGMQLIMVTLGCADDFNSQKQWFDAAFDRYDPVTFLTAGEPVARVPAALGAVTVTTAQDVVVAAAVGERLSMVVHLPARVSFFSDPQTPVGTAEIQVNGQTVTTVALVRTDAQQRGSFAENLRIIAVNW